NISSSPVVNFKDSNIAGFEETHLDLTPLTFWSKHFGIYRFGFFPLRGMGRYLEINRPIKMRAWLENRLKVFAIHQEINHFNAAGKLLERFFIVIPTREGEEYEKWLSSRVAKASDYFDVTFIFILPLERALRLNTKRMGINLGRLEYLGIRNPGFYRLKIEDKVKISPTTSLGEYFREPYSHFFGRIDKHRVNIDFGLFDLSLDWYRGESKPIRGDNDEARTLLKVIINSQDFDKLYYYIAYITKKMHQNHRAMAKLRTYLGSSILIAHYGEARAKIILDLCQADQKNDTQTNPDSSSPVAQSHAARIKADNVSASALPAWQVGANVATRGESRNIGWQINREPLAPIKLFKNLFVAELIK
nr:hypothetical protein [Candidatus Omnitrophota bacterium]